MKTPCYFKLYQPKGGENVNTNIKYHIGLRYGDFEIIDRIGVKVKLKCLVCGRESTLSCGNAFEKRDNTHGNICSKLVCREKNIHDTQFYRIWANMKTRTTNQNYEKWDRYGGRGINSDEFKYFVDFYDTMYESYKLHVEKYGEENTTLDRIDTDGNYCKDNCRWATWIQQCKNKSSLLNFKAVSPEGEEHTGINLKEFCEDQKIPYSIAIGGIHNGNKSWRNGWFFEVV